MNHIENSGQTEGETAETTEDATGTTEQTEVTGETQETTTTAEQTTTAQRTLTQEEVDKLVGNTRTKAREKAVESLIEELGVQDVDSLKELVKQAEERRLANLSEVEKLQEQIKSLGEVQQQSKATSKELKAYQEAVENTVANQLKSLNIPSHVAALLENMPALEKLNYLSENAKHFAKPMTTNTNAATKGSGNTATSKEEQLKKVRAKYGIN